MPCPLIETPRSYREPSQLASSSPGNIGHAFVSNCRRPDKNACSGVLPRALSAWVLGHPAGARLSAASGGSDHYRLNLYCPPTGPEHEGSPVNSLHAALGVELAVWLKVAAGNSFALLLTWAVPQSRLHIAVPATKILFNLSLYKICFFVLWNLFS